MSDRFDEVVKIWLKRIKLLKVIVYKGPANYSKLNTKEKHQIDISNILFA